MSCEQIIPTAVKDLFEKIAITHPGIGHAPEAEPPVIRFYGYNNDEAISGEATDLGSPRMGLSLKTHSAMYGSYSDRGGATNDNLNIEVEFLEKNEVKDYANEYGIYDRMKLVMDDTITWLQNAIHTDVQYQFPAIQRLDLKNANYLRVGPVHDSCYGWRLIIPLQAMLQLDDDNPLRNMTP